MSYTSGMAGVILVIVKIFVSYWVLYGLIFLNHEAEKKYGSIVNNLLIRIMKWILSFMLWFFVSNIGGFVNINPNLLMVLILIGGFLHLHYLGNFAEKLKKEKTEDKTTK